MSNNGVHSLFPLRPMNTNVDISQKPGWIEIDKVCAQMSVTKQKTVIAGNLKITQKCNLDNKENNSPDSACKTTPEKRIDSDKDLPIVTSESTFLIEQIILMGIKTETELCSPELLMCRSSSHITDSMRFKTIDWLSEVCLILKIIWEVFFLAVDILDRYLSSEGSRSLKSTHLQLVGISCLSISSKYEGSDSYTPNIYASMTAGAFSTEELVNMELRVLRSLNWRLHVPTAFSWLKIFLQLHATNALEINRPLHSSYNLKRGASFLSTFLMHSSSLRFPRSLIASAVFMIVNGMSNSVKEIWENMTKYKMIELNLCLSDVMSIVNKQQTPIDTLCHQASRGSKDHHNSQPLHENKKKRFCYI